VSNTYLVDGLQEKAMKRLNGKKIGVIGSGNMAGALIGGLLRKEELTPDQITASDPYQEQLDIISKKYSVSVTVKNVEAVKTADIVILSVKPQVLPPILEELKGNIDVPVFSTTTTTAAFENGVGELVKEIEKSLQGVKPVEKMLTIFDKPNTPVKIWFSEKDQKAIKIEQGEANDSGQFTGTSSYFFVNGDLWFSDQPFAKFIFESDKLKYWLDENWNINQIPEENIKSREENIKQNLVRILK